MEKSWWEDSWARQEVVDGILANVSNSELIFGSCSKSDWMDLTGISSQATSDASQDYLNIMLYNAVFAYKHLPPRQFKCYAQTVASLAKNLSKLGIKTAEDVRRSLPALVFGARNLAQCLPGDMFVTITTGQLKQNIEKEERESFGQEHIDQVEVALDEMSLDISRG